MLVLVGVVGIASTVPGAGGGSRWRCSPWWSWAQTDDEQNCPAARAARLSIHCRSENFCAGREFSSDDLQLLVARSRARGSLLRPKCHVMKRAEGRGQAAIPVGDAAQVM